ncbi:MAG TPA: triphosphoribosyl-dephospho-CoA synthase [Acidobacteriaceae bacterium]
MQFSVLEPRFERAVEDRDANRLAVLAVDALRAEAELTPKPGLVDRRGPGAHADMSLDLMLRSASTLRPFFREMAEISQGRKPSQQLREELAQIGRRAERAMLVSTGGVNTHKGGIWLLGLLTASASLLRAQTRSSAHVAETARIIARFEDRRSLAILTHGDLVRRRYGATGARGEAQKGFPHILSAGLPRLRSQRAAEAIEEHARLDALLLIMTTLEDTCLLYRGGKNGLLAAQRGAAAVLEAGGSATSGGMKKLLALDTRLVRLRLSPGGSADLMAATLFVDAIEQGASRIQTRTSASSPRISSVNEA